MQASAGRQDIQIASRSVTGLLWPCEAALETFLLKLLGLGDGVAASAATGHHMDMPTTQSTVVGSRMSLGCQS